MESESSVMESGNRGIGGPEGWNLDLNDFSRTVYGLLHPDLHPHYEIKKWWPLGGQQKSL